MLFAGRLMAMVVNFGVHVLIVRYLSKADYGAFAYAMSLATLGCSVVDFGLHRAISRLVPIYHEQLAFKKMAGTILLSVMTILSFGLAGALLVFILQDLIGRHFINDQRAVSLLLILVFMSPVEALDRLLVSLFAIFAKPKAIFFRRYIVGPALKVLVVSLLIGGQCSVFFLAGGYLAATLLGVMIYATVLVRLLHKEGLLVHFGGPLDIPWREILTFTIPLLSTDLLHIFNNGMDAILLGHYVGAEGVAALRAVRPTAVLNEVVFTSFAILFTPQAARLFARRDAEGMNHLYWQSAAWIAMLTFPVFLLTFSLAQPLTEVLFGTRYHGSGAILAVLSLGYYIQAAFGFNGTTLTIYGRVGYTAAMNLGLALVSITLSLLLIPRYGPIGAAISTCSTIVLHNFFKQLGLLLFTDVSLMDWRYVRVYLTIAIGACGMLVVQWLTELSVIFSVLIAALIFVGTLRLNRDLLDIEKTFPELLRIPLLPLLLGRKG
jgi:O-antigen/teichoic acid export membrane protein